ncbi:MAG: hypothetical protein SFV23_13725 [Planctomycetaceae bacterium]|nr:hypothetical protein [Planctomycetaceae bacterium]
MSIELAEKLKTKLTDQWVVVDGSVPELKRFSQWTGKVKTVNMNGRALVEFDGPVDISWYDIDPAYLTVVDGPRPKKPVEHAPKAAAPAKPAAAAPAGVSPLQAARAQGAAAPAAGKPSPLDMIRKQGAAKKEADAEAPPAAVLESAPAEEPAPAAKPAPVATTSADGKKLSPLEMIRKQGAAKRD